MFENKMNRKRLLSIVLSGALSISGIASAGNVPSLAKADVSLAKKEISLNISENSGKTTYEKAKLKVKSGKGIKLKKTSFKVKDGTVAKVSKKGVVTAKKAGSTKVVVTVSFLKKKNKNTKKLNASITVKDLRNSVATAPAEISATPVASATPKSQGAAEPEVVPGSLSHDGYELKKVVILSRHNIRSPISGNGSVLGQITPHEWFEWSSTNSGLSLRGGTLETEMGQYFRKWLENEKLFPENYHPNDGEVRFYSNAKQRTIATAQYFSSGLLPTANQKVEYKVEFDKMDPVFTPQFTFVTDKYADAVKAQISELFSKTIEGLADNYKLIGDVIDMEQSEGYKSGAVAPFRTDDTTINVEINKEPTMNGSLKTGCSVSDAMVLQYYEEEDPVKAAFGKELSIDQWKSISEIKDIYGDVLFTAPLVASNVANPILKEIRKEMNEKDRKFTFLCGHDSNIGSVLAALGVEEYDLPNSIEKKTPIGGKVVLAKYVKDGKEFWSADLVYQTTNQLRNLTLLDLKKHPAVFAIPLKGLSRNSDGLFAAKDFEGRIDSAISEYDKIVAEYSDAKTEPEVKIAA